MLFKTIRGEYEYYICPIFSEFEKNYILSEIDMLLSNGATEVVFDNFKENSLLVYSRHYPIGNYVGVLNTCLFELLKARIVKNGVDCESFLDFANIGSSEDNHTGQVRITFDLQKIKDMLEKGFQNYTTEYTRCTDGRTSKKFFANIMEK